MENKKEIEEKEETQIVFFRDSMLWRLEERVQGFCARQGIEIINIQYSRWFFSHTCIIIFKQKWLAFLPNLKVGASVCLRSDKYIYEIG